MSWFSKLFGGGGGGSDPGNFMVDIPPFYQDEFYKPTQDLLFGIGQDLLAGEPNEYFKPIGEIGGPGYQDVLQRTVRDTVDATEESAIKRGVGRGGGVSTSVSRNVADVTSKMNWNDFIRALSGREKLLSVGNDMVTGVRSAGLTNQAQKNSYQLNSAGLEMKNLENGFDIAGKMGGSDGDFLGNVLGSVEGLLEDFDFGGGGSDSMSPMDIESLVSGGSAPRGSAEGEKKEFYKDPKFYMDVAKLAAMFAGGCWVAAAVFNGWDDVRTHNARYFINFMGPLWFKRFYLANGEKIAEFIKDKAILRMALRPLFEIFSFLGNCGILAQSKTSLSLVKGGV